MMMKLPIGDTMHIYASLESGVDYTVRLQVRMQDPIDGQLLRDALQKTEKRYPYFSVRLAKDEQQYYFEDNPAPVALLNTSRKITLNSSETNNHVWAVCYEEDKIFLDFYHGITDGTGVYMVLATLLYYYCNGRYGLTESTGIHTLEEPVSVQETYDPLARPLIDRLTKEGAISMSEDGLFGAFALPRSGPREAFSIIHDGGANRIEPMIYDIEIPERAFVAFTSSSDASPGTMVSLLMLRALDAAYPNREKPLIGSYVVNARPMLNAVGSYHNCISALDFVYEGQLRAMPFAYQTTAFRGITFLGSDEEKVQRNIAGFDWKVRDILANCHSLEEKKAAFAQMRTAALRRHTSIVSYIGPWAFPAIGQYIEELWVHAPSANNCLGELSAVNGKIGLSLHLCSDSENIVDRFFEELRENDIPYGVKAMAPNDVPAFAEPL